ncbi:hypothetical protein HY572_03645 [Candidatus Micrarchaeota archaeon]|nr:hypothetical protein [Candidatus Micrarchaeota archaeon]
MTEVLDVIGRMHNHVIEHGFQRFGVTKPPEPREIQGHSLKVYRVIYENPTGYHAPSMDEQAPSDDPIERLRSQLTEKYPNVLVHHYRGATDLEGFTTIDFADKNDPTLSKADVLNVYARLGMGPRGLK